MRVHLANASGVVLGRGGVCALAVADLIAATAGRARNAIVSTSSASRTSARLGLVHLEEACQCAGVSEGWCPSKYTEELARVALDEDRERRVELLEEDGGEEVGGLAGGEAGQNARTGFKSQKAAHLSESDVVKARADSAILDDVMTRVDMWHSSMWCASSSSVAR